MTCLNRFVLFAFAQNCQPTRRRLHAAHCVGHGYNFDYEGDQRKVIRDPSMHVLGQLEQRHLQGRSI